MNVDTARSVAEAMLYEGYVLFPYRASAQKNRSRWQFGVLMPESYAAADPTEASANQTECLLEYADDSVLRVIVRFLQVQQRLVQQRLVQARPPGSEEYADVPGLVVGGVPVTPWDEAVERELELRVEVAQLLESERRHSLHTDAGVETELIGSAQEGRLVRRRSAISGLVTVSASPLPLPWRVLRLRVRVENHTALDPVPDRRDAALPQALVAVHTIVGVEHGAFVSMLEPPQWAQPFVDDCEVVGTWPVLAGADGQHDVILSSPIILYDHPEVAAESPGTLYDTTEIDEILTLRTLALTDEEKREARATDPRAGALIDHVEALDTSAIERMHGTIRSLRPVEDSLRPAGPWWDPEADTAQPETVLVWGVRLEAGSSVRLRPGVRRADAQDMFLAGRLATVEAVLRDLDDQPYLAVTLADDPGADLQRNHGRFLYFTPDEVEPV
jgi:hypothetical protein